VQSQRDPERLADGYTASVHVNTSHRVYRFALLSST